MSLLFILTQILLHYLLLFGFAVIFTTGMQVIMTGDRYNIIPTMYPPRSSLRPGSSSTQHTKKRVKWEEASETVKNFVKFLRSAKIDNVKDAYKFIQPGNMANHERWEHLCRVGWVYLDPYYGIYKDNNAKLILTDKTVEEAFDRLDSKDYEEWCLPIISKDTLIEPETTCSSCNASRSNTPIPDMISQESDTSMTSLTSLVSKDELQMYRDYISTDQIKKATDNNLSYYMCQKCGTGTLFNVTDICEVYRMGGYTYDLDCSICKTTGSCPNCPFNQCNKCKTRWCDNCYNSCSDKSTDESTNTCTKDGCDGSVVHASSLLDTASVDHLHLEVD